MTSRLCGGSVGGCATHPSSRTSGVNVMNKNYRIAVIPGDGIGKEVVRKAFGCWRRPASTFRFGLSMMVDFRLLSDYYPSSTGGCCRRTGRQKIGGHDAIFLGPWAGPKCPTTSRCGVADPIAANSINTSIFGRCG